MTTGVGVAVARVALAFTGSGRVVERAFACLAASTCARLNGGARAENRRLERGLKVSERMAIAGPGTALLSFSLGMLFSLLRCGNRRPDRVPHEQAPPPAGSLESAAPSETPARSRPPRAVGLPLSTRAPRARAHVGGAPRAALQTLVLAELRPQSRRYGVARRLRRSWHPTSRGTPVTGPMGVGAWRRARGRGGNSQARFTGYLVTSGPWQR